MFQDLIPELQGPAADLLQAAGEARLLPRITSTRRTRAAQARLYRRYLSGLSPLPAAPPGLSSHEYGYAFDMVVSPMEALADVGYTWQCWGGIWGGAADPVHFQFPGFVVPSPTTFLDFGETVRGAARTFADLPWYLQILLPLSTTTKEVGPAEEARLRARACQLFGLGCNP